VPGPGIVVFIFTFLGYVVSSIAIFLRKYRHSAGLFRQQLKYLLLGSVLMFIALFTFNFLFVVLLGQNQFIAFGPLSIFFFIGAATYAIVRYRLMEIQLVIKRSLILSLLIASTVMLYTLIIYGAERFILYNSPHKNAYAGIFATFVIVLTLDPLKGYIERITQKVFYKIHYDSEQTLLRLGKSISETINLQSISYRLVNAINQDMKPTGLGLWLVHKNLRNGKMINTHLIKAEGEMAIDHKDVNAICILARDINIQDICVTDELALQLRRPTTPKKSKARLLWLLQRQQIAVLIPLIYKNEYVGMFLLKGKKSQDAYNREDINLLDLMAHQAAIAIDNALLYAELEDRVKHRTAELEEANRHLKRLDKAKTEFLSIASHQLRTPLSAIRGYASLLEDGDFGAMADSQKIVMGKIQDNTKRLVSLVNDLLSLARIEAGADAKGLNLQEMDFNEIVDQTVEELAIKAEKQGISLNWHHPQKKFMVVIDREKIEQVVMNLIDNAVYYTPKGKIDIRIKKDGDNLIFSVKDTGIGIDEEGQQNLFNKFFRANNAGKLRPDGTGIGLYVVKMLTEAHRGKAWFESELGKGSTFYISLPMRQGTGK